MFIAKLGAAVAAGAVILSATLSPATAGSYQTNVFMTNILPNVDFLDRSSRLAVSNSKNDRLKDFARSEAKEQTVATNALDTWVKNDPVVIAAAAGAPEQVLTGRSVAVDGEQVADNRLPTGQEDLDRLEGLNGREFDDLFKEKQLEALTQIKTDYQDYLAKGDDPALLSMSKRELPKIERRLAMLRKL